MRRFQAGDWAAVDWSLSNVALAQQIGCLASTVGRWRRRLGRPAYRNRGVVGWRQCRGSGPVYEARRALGISRPQLEAMTGIDRNVIGRVEQSGAVFVKADLVRRFNAAVPPEHRIHKTFKPSSARASRERGWQVQAVAALCLQCGTVITPQASVARRGGGRYCSSQCFGLAHTRRVEVPCACGCGAVLSVIPSRAKRSTRLFVDQQHRTRWYHRQGLPPLQQHVAALGAGLAKAVEVSTRYCPKCQQRKPTTAFGPHRRRSDGLNPYCRACVAAAKRARKQSAR